MRIWDFVPADERWRARRQTELRRPEAQRWVAELYDELGGPAEVVRRTEGAGEAGPVLLRLALREVLRREAR